MINDNTSFANMNAKPTSISNYAANAAASVPTHCVSILFHLNDNRPSRLTLPTNRRAANSHLL
jgi:hypothetical protein